MNSSRHFEYMPPGSGASRRAARILVPCLVLLCLSSFVTPAVRAEQVPRNLVYPPHTTVTYYPDLTNRDFDCSWGWYCEEREKPYVHFLTADALNRTGGWASFGEVENKKLGYMSFQLYSSVYSESRASDMPPWNQLATWDEQMALVSLWGSTAARTVPSMLPSGVQGGVFARYADGKIWHIFFLTAWLGDSHEIEAGVFYYPGKKWEARRYLVDQGRTAISLVGTM